MPVTIGAPPHRYARPQRPQQHVRRQGPHDATEYDQPYFASSYVEDGYYEDDRDESDFRINANNCNQPLDHLGPYDGGEDDGGGHVDVHGDQGMATTTSGGASTDHRNRRVTSWHGMTSSNWDDDSDDARRVASEPYFNSSRNRIGTRTEIRPDPQYDPDINDDPKIYYTTPDPDEATLRQSNSYFGASAVTPRRSSGMENTPSTRQSGQDVRSAVVESHFDEVDPYDVELTQVDGGDEEEDMGEEEGEEDEGDEEEEREEADEDDDDDDEDSESTETDTTRTTRDTNTDTSYDYNYDYDYGEYDEDSDSYSGSSSTCYSTSGESSDSTTTTTTAVTASAKRSFRRRNDVPVGGTPITNRRHPLNSGRKFLTDLHELCREYRVVPRNSAMTRLNCNTSATTKTSKHKMTKWNKASSTTTTTTNDEVDSDSDSKTSDCTSSVSMTSSDRRRPAAAAAKKRRGRCTSAAGGIEPRRRRCHRVGGSGGSRPFLHDGDDGTGDGSRHDNANMSAAKSDVVDRRRHRYGNQRYDNYRFDDDEDDIDDRYRTNRKHRSASASTDEMRRWRDHFRNRGLRPTEGDDGKTGNGNVDREELSKEASLRNDAKRQLEAAGGAELVNTRRRILKIVALALEDESGEFSIFDMSFRRMKSLDERSSGVSDAINEQSAQGPASAVAIESVVSQSTAVNGGDKLLRRGSLEMNVVAERSQINNNNVGHSTASSARTKAAASPPPQKAMMKMDAFAASEDLLRPVTTTRLHGLDLKDSNAVCEHFLNFGRFLFDLYQKNKCTDITIQMTTHVDNKSVTSTLRAHRVVLVSHSTWFAEQILNGGPWVVAEIIYLDNVCGADTCPVLPATVNALVEYMYTGRLAIDTSNVVQLLVASEKLGIAEVVKLCCANIDSLPPDNVLQVIGAACDYGLNDVALLEAKWHQIAGSFTDVVRSRAFHQLGVDAVCRLLSRDDLMVSSERDVVEACLRWINADRPGRLQHVGQVLGCVKFSRLRPDELVWLTNSENYLLTDQKIRDAILEANWLHTRVNAKTAAR